jgi:methylamine dehydrogenase light chain
MTRPRPSLDLHADRWLEAGARALARGTSRRSFLSRLGTLLVGAAAVPLLPVARGRAEPPRPVVPGEEGIQGSAGDPTSCEYWRHCAIDGFLCSCCGGSQSSCPPGSQMTPVTWIGTCRNPADGKDYIISYNDCCGKGYCGRCMCNRNEGEKPPYVPPKNNDINWCVGTDSSAYHCSTAVVIGAASTR